jgi:hypothetical protein
MLYPQVTRTGQMGSEMTLAKEIEARRTKIKTDGYSMSIGELLSMYRSGEIDIHPEFQRFFRWTSTQKSRLIESLLLGIPVPSIFVAQRQDGVWDVVDGLQRLSTIFELTGDLKDDDGKNLPKLALSGTKYLPSFEGKVWEETDDATESANSLGREHQLLIKRAKLDIKIVLRESDDASKYELFQRLNTGGSALSDQELRNCIVIMVDRSFFQWMRDLGEDKNFRDCVGLTERALDEQYHLELVTRFLVFRKKQAGVLSDKTLLKDLGSFRNDQLVVLASDPQFDRAHEAAAFKATFKCLKDALGDEIFHRYDSKKERFAGPFLISAFEALAIGLAFHFHPGKKLPDVKTVLRKAKALWNNGSFLDGIGSGVTASSRIPVTIPCGRALWKS